MRVVIVIVVIVIVVTGGKQSQLQSLDWSLTKTRPSTGLGSCDNNDLEDHFLSKLPTHLKNTYPAALNKEPLFI